MEPPVSHMNELFPILERILVDVTTDQSQNFMAYVPHRIIDATIEVVMR